MILSYCMNVHPGETPDELVDLIAGPAARAREGFRPGGDMGAGLWLPLACARAIAEDEGIRERVRAALSEAGLFAFTVNAFPIGGFHNRRVKERVYHPDWTSVERLEYTELACRALAQLLPEGARGSVSTVPVGFKDEAARLGGATDAKVLSAAARHLGELTLDLIALEGETGHEVSVALEPEPLAILETTAEAIAFFEAHVFGGAAREFMVERGVEPDAAEAALRKHLGVCVDTCHLACEFETISASLAELAKAGVRVVKGQLSSALEVVRPAENAEGLRRLTSFDEPRYLHQSIGQLASGELVRAVDLPDLTKSGALAEGFVGVEAVRTHFHVPLTWAGDDVLGTTRPALKEGLAALAKATDHLEVETYTWGVLPDEERARFDDDVVKMVVGELTWAAQALGG